MRTLKEIVHDAHQGAGPFKMTALECIRVMRACVVNITPAQIEEYLEGCMKGGSLYYGRPVVIV